MDIEADLIAYIQTQIKDRGARLAADSALLSNGLLDSMGVLGVVEFIEGRFKVALAPQDLDPQNFESVGLIAALVRRKQESSDGRA